MNKVIKKLFCSGFIPMFIPVSVLFSTGNQPVPLYQGPQQYQIEEWQPASGDTLTVDVSTNMGYLRHENGDFVEFQVATGQQRYVYYIGRGYYAATPVREWEVKEMEIKGDRVTFGAAGRFLRLYYNGESTPYGIHSYLYEDRMFAGTRYGSMGCIIPKDAMLDVIENTYHLNGDYLKVTTISGFDSMSTR